MLVRSRRVRPANGRAVRVTGLQYVGLGRVCRFGICPVILEETEPKMSFCCVPTNLALSILLLASSASANQAVFIDLGKRLLLDGTNRGLPWGAQIQLGSISGDGSAIGGSIIWDTSVLDCANLACGQLAFAWSLESDQPLTIPSLEPADGRPWRRFPLAVTGWSADAEVAAVAFDQNDGWYQSESYLVTGEEIAEVNLSGAANGWFYATDISADGRVIVGHQLRRDDEGRPTSYQALRWTSGIGFEEIAAESPWSKLLPVAVSGDGMVTVLSDLGLSLGYRVDTVNAAIAGPNGVAELLPVEGANVSVARAASFGGEAVVGTSHFADEGRSTATLWSAGSPTELMTPSEFSSTGNDVTADGRTVAGSLRPNSDESDNIPWNAWEERIAAMRLSEAATWNGEQLTIVETLLAEKFGLSDELAGWSLTSTELISDDGRVIAGQGVDPDGIPTVWVAILPIPEPTTSGIVFVPLAITAGLRQRT